MRIIDARAKQLIRRIEEAKWLTPAVDNWAEELVLHLQEACAHPDVAARYAAYAGDATSDLTRMPIANGYVVSFDPVEQEDEFFDCWRRFGIVAGKQVVSKGKCKATVRRIHQLMREISGGRCLLGDRTTWLNMPRDAAYEPIISRSFFEVYHDDALAQLRQALRIYLHHVLIWGRTDLWTSFDRLGIKLPGHEESKALPMHVDQNPTVHPNFRTVQGVLALVDCPANRGTFAAVPGSKQVFVATYTHMVKNKGEYVELDRDDQLYHPLASRLQALPLRAGDLISWDSRTTHANTENSSGDSRFVAYIAAGPAREDNATLVAVRDEAFNSGLGSNVREALMHASKRPRYNNPNLLSSVRAAEKLTLLGRLLYGQQRYADLSPGASA